LTFLIGFLLLVALAVMIVGPRFGEWLAYRAHLSRVWVWVWPYIHWTLAIAFTVLAVEALYFLAPNVKQRFWASLPGAPDCNWHLDRTLLPAGHLLSKICEL
jgi:uncharacterized BrkB/YihY/UPF0761 family membrane protein